MRILRLEGDADGGGRGSSIGEGIAELARRQELLSDECRRT